jgi:hypothetical protein
MNSQLLVGGVVDTQVCDWGEFMLNHMLLGYAPRLFSYHPKIFSKT